MRIAMLSWRYLGHPQGGGAEVVTHEILRRLAAEGHEVTAFTASYPGAEPESTIDGVRVLRRGQQWSVHVHAWRWLRRRRDSFDRVIDQINTIPFATPLYVPEDRRRFLIWQLAREYWWRETRGIFKLVAPLGYATEPLILRLYRRTRGMTISASSRQDLGRLGIAETAIDILPMASLEPPRNELNEKSIAPWRCVIVGRLTQAKFVEEGLTAFSLIQDAIPSAKLDVIGSGDPRYRTRLDTLIAQRRIEGVTFHGRVDESRKRDLLGAAHLHIFTSHREGWGLTVTEAGGQGTPTIGYDAPGVRDSIGDRRLLAPIGDISALANLAVGLHRDDALYEAVRNDAWRRARELTFDATKERFVAALK
jgi:glycosyltransferase involved in cell wall biosynthesis